MPADPTQRYRFVCFKCSTRFDYTQGEAPLSSSGVCKTCGSYGGWKIYKLNKDGTLGEQC
jgi:rRNA maturation endonuclease Nob1